MESGAASRHQNQVMLGFKNFDRAAITIASIELLHRIRKNQFALRDLHMEDTAATAIWNTILAA